MKRTIVCVYSAILALILVSCGDSGTLSADGDLSSSSGEASSSSGVASSSSFTKDWFNVSISYGSMTDTRDNQVYKTVVIGTQTWMAENLNYASTSVVSRCEKCTIYGRLYDWNSMMAGATSSTDSPSGVQGICPSGWHVPSNAEWDVLETFVGGSSTAGTKLKANSNLWYENTGTDDYGFSALPGGYYFGSASITVGYNGYWWSTTEYSTENAYEQKMNYKDADVSLYNNDKPNGCSLRCVKD
jgi:uncharacterized protein (TIGR02145 family)